MCMIHKFFTIYCLYFDLTKQTTKCHTQLQTTHHKFQPQNKMYTPVNLTNKTPHSIM